MYKFPLQSPALRVVSGLFLPPPPPPPLHSPPKKTYLKQKQSRTPLIRSLVIRIALALRVNVLWLQLYYIFVWHKCFPQMSNYLLTPRRRVILEKLTGLQLVKKFPAFHGTRRFITALTSVRHQSLSWASPIQSIYPHLTSCRSILILSTHLRLGHPSVKYILEMMY